jgi:hypothetical protein
LQTFEKRLQEVEEKFEAKFESGGHQNTSKLGLEKPQNKDIPFSDSASYSSAEEDEDFFVGSQKAESDRFLINRAKQSQTLKATRMFVLKNHLDLTKMGYCFIVHVLNVNYILHIQSDV